jgi:hypothetical protein
MQQSTCKWMGYLSEEEMDGNKAKTIVTNIIYLFVYVEHFYIPITRY